MVRSQSSRHHRHGSRKSAAIVIATLVGSGPCPADLVRPVKTGEASSPRASGVREHAPLPASAAPDRACLRSRRDRRRRRRPTAQSAQGRSRPSAKAVDRTAGRSRLPPSRRRRPAAAARTRSSRSSTASRSASPSSKSPSGRCRSNIATCRSRRCSRCCSTGSSTASWWSREGRKNKVTEDAAFKKRMAFVEDQVLQDFWIQREIARKVTAEKLQERYEERSKPCRPRRR